MVVSNYYINNLRKSIIITNILTFRINVFVSKNQKRAVSESLKTVAATQLQS